MSLGGTEAEQEATNGAPGTATNGAQTLRTGLLASLLETRSQELGGKNWGGTPGGCNVEAGPGCFGEQAVWHGVVEWDEGGWCSVFVLLDVFDQEIHCPKVEHFVEGLFPQGG